MAVRGAVAEKHLEKILTQMVRNNTIDRFQRASGDTDKDFYLEIAGAAISVECKNVEVAKIATKGSILSYLAYLSEKKLINVDEILRDLQIRSSPVSELKLKDLKRMLSEIPQKLRESGLVRYQYSAEQVKQPQLDKLDEKIFIEQFNAHPLAIDFKRTRNSTAKDGNTRRNRFYRVEEIDIVAACLFARTMEWNFLFAKANQFARHDEYPERYSDKVVLKPDIWVSNLTKLV